MGWCCAKQAGSGRVGGEALVSTTRGGTYTSTSSSQEGKVWRWERGRCRGRRRGESWLHPAPCWWKSLVKFHSPQNWAASGWGRKNKPEMTPTLQELRDSKLIWKDFFFLHPFFKKVEIFTVAATLKALACILSEAGATSSTAFESIKTTSCQINLGFWRPER